MDVCENDPPNITIDENQVKCWLYDNKTKNK